MVEQVDNRHEPSWVLPRAGPRSCSLVEPTVRPVIHIDSDSENSEPPAEASTVKQADTQIVTVKPSEPK